MDINSSNTKSKKLRNISNLDIKYFLYHLFNYLFDLNITFKF